MLHGLHSLHSFWWWWHRRKTTERITDAFKRFKRMSIEDIMFNWEDIFFDFSLPKNKIKLKLVIKALVQSGVIRKDNSMANVLRSNVLPLPSAIGLTNETNDSIEDIVDYVFLKSENIFNMFYWGRSF